MSLPSPPAIVSLPVPPFRLAGALMALDTATMSLPSRALTVIPFTAATGTGPPTRMDVLVVPEMLNTSTRGPGTISMDRLSSGLFGAVAPVTMMALEPAS